jgi:hypothetical protein
MGLIQAGAFTNFPTASAAGQYWIVNRDGNLRDPITGVLTPVVIGNQVLATSPGNLSTNFNVVSNPAGVIDIGSPSNFVFPQITVTNSQVVLDWKATETANAIQYFVWGRVGGAVGILATLDSDTTSYVDDGGFTPVVTPITSYSPAAIRYNKLNSLVVNTTFADRQTSASLPVRDTL